MSNSKTKIAYLSNRYSGRSRCLFSSIAAAGISANISLFSKDKSLSLTEEIIANNIRRKSAQNKSDVIYIAADSAGAALRGADIVILDFEALPARVFAKLLEITREYHINPYRGENAGVISSIAAAAIIPEIFEIATEIKDRAPGAVVLSISSPMSAVMRTLIDVFPEMRLIGKTDETESFYELIRYLIKNAYGVQKVSRRDIKCSVLGIPSFSFAASLTYDGNDILPIIKNAAEENFKNGIAFHSGDTSKARFDFFLRYGLLPINSDSVIADFVPNWYADMGISKITADEVREEAANYKLTTKPLKNGTAVLPAGYFTESALIIKAFCDGGGGNLITDAAAVNHGQIDNLSEGAVVQTNCLVSKNCFAPLASGIMPAEVASLCSRHIVNTETLLTAAKMRDLDIVFNAFINEPRMSLTLTKASEVFRKMLEAASKELAYYAI
jgi:alpha-galactosidase